MMSVVIAASGIASRTSRRIARYRSLRYERRIARSTRSEPDCSGMCSWWQTFGGLRHRLDHVGGEVARVRRGEPDPLQPVDPPAGPQQLGERRPVAELDAVGVDVLARAGSPRARRRRPASAPRRGCRPAGGRPPCHAATARCRTCRCCCSPPRSTPSRSMRSRAGPAATTGRPRASPGSPAAPRRCAGPAPAASAATRRCGCRTRRRPTAPGEGSRRGPSAPGSRRPRSACPGARPSPAPGGRGCRTACCPRSPGPRRC